MSDRCSTTSEQFPSREPGRAAPVIPAAAISPARTRPTGWSASIRRAATKSPTSLADQSLGRSNSTRDQSATFAVAGTEFSREVVSLDSYTGLNSEAIGSGSFASGTVGPVSVLNPPNNF